MNLIEINNLSKSYYTKSKEIKALDNITINIKKVKITCILGPSGCGKSTLLNIIANLENQTSGSIKDNNLIIGYMMQQDNLFPWLTVYENAIIGLKLTKKLNEDNIDYVINLLKKYDLYSFKDESINNLSGGMKQRLALIRTLAIKPNILLLDEPFSKLDIDTRISISDNIYSIIRELNMTAILITHDIAEALSVSDEIIILTKRPGKLKMVYENKLIGKPSIRRTNNKFNDYYSYIWNNLDHV